MTAMTFLYIGLATALFGLAVEYRHHLTAYLCMAVLIFFYVVFYLPGRAWRYLRDGY